MTVHIISLFYQDVFKKFSSKYNIYRDLYSLSLYGLEIRNLQPEVSENVRKIVLLNKEICYYRNNSSTSKVDLLVLGNYEVFKLLAKEILASGNEDIGYRISRLMSNFYDYDFRISSLWPDNPAPSKSKIMGILNVTPDSFSDKGRYFDKNKAVTHALNLLNDGADIIDIGGESTRPNSKRISKEEELDRVIPVIEIILKEKPDAILSLDTSKAEVAEEGLKRGVKIINDISAFTFEEEILKTVSSFNAHYILMHMKGIPENMQNSPYYEEVVSEVYDFIVAKLKVMKKYSIKNIIIDPGIGFGKRTCDNYELLQRLNEFKGIGWPILVGLSNKSFLGKSLTLEVDNRVEASLASETIAIMNGAKYLRTHNVKNAVKAREIVNYVLKPELLND